METILQVSSDESRYTNKKLNCIINGMYLNQDNSLLCIATDKGFQIFDSYNFVQLSVEDEYQDLIGPLKLAIPFYESHLVMLVGKNEFSTFPNSHLILWDDIKKLKIGVIILKEKIIDAKIFKEAIYIMITNKILIFGTRNLNFLYSINDIDHSRTQNLFISVNVNPIVIVNVPMTRPNQLKVTKCNDIQLIFS